MTIDDQFKDEKLQYDINKETAKISALSSRKIHKYQYLTGEDILPSNQKQIIEQAKFTYSPLGKAFDKQTKTIKKQCEKQVEALNNLNVDNNLATDDDDDIIPENAFANDEAKRELDKIREIDETINREKLVCRATEYIYDFRNFRTVRTFGRDIYEGKSTLEGADEDQSKLVDDFNNFVKRTKPQNNNKQQKKEIDLENLYKLFEAREKVLKAFESKIFLIKPQGSGILNTVHSKLKVLTPKQMLQRLPIALAQVKAGNNSQNLLNEIRQIIYSLYQSKEITKKVYNNIIKLL